MLWVGPRTLLDSSARALLAFLSSWKVASAADASDFIWAELASAACRGARRVQRALNGAGLEH